MFDTVRLERATTLYIAHDQDPEPKIQVLSAIRQLALFADSLGLEAKVVTWDTRLGKGLDDLLTGDGDWTLLSPAHWWGSLTGEQRASVEARLQGSCVNSPVVAPRISSSSQAPL
ncbi:MAG: DUF3854 domain-containing protein [Blastocatellia bacterium]